MFGTLLELCDSVCEKFSSVEDIVFMCSEKKQKEKKKTKISVLGFAPARSISSSPTLQFYGDAVKPHKMASFPASLSARSFPLTPI